MPCHNATGCVGVRCAADIKKGGLGVTTLPAWLPAPSEVSCVVSVLLYLDLRATMRAHTGRRYPVITHGVRRFGNQPVKGVTDATRTPSPSRPAASS